MKFQSYFPHIYRKFPATIFLLFIMIIINIFHAQILGVDEEKRLQQDIIFKPESHLLHEKLAQYYLLVNAQAAQKEYTLAEDLFQNSSSASENIAGIKSSPWQTWLNIVSNQEKLTGEVKYWQAVLTRLPDYQYANLKLANFYYQLGEMDKSNQFLQNILHEDPTNTTALLLLSNLK